MSAPQADIDNVCTYRLTDFIFQATIASEGYLLLTDRLEADQSINQCKYGVNKLKIYTTGH